MLRAVTIAAYAKINLTLDILGRRSDGYHEVEMIMHSVELADEVDITESGTGRLIVTCDNPLLPQGEGNLAFRAASAFFARMGREIPGIDIAIRKRIPSEAGLAGGSADAAAVLVGLDRLLGTGLVEEALREIGLAVGADVPFCVTGGSRLSRGVGEKLEALPLLPECTLVLAKPEESVSTAAAYAAFDRMAAPERPDTQGMIRALGAGDLAQVSKKLCNVLEGAAGLKSVENLREAMTRSGALGASMTGSGSAVFGLFADRSKAEACAETLRSRAEAVFVCDPESRGCRILRAD